MNDIRSLLDKEDAWLKDEATCKQVNGWMEITTPYLDRHNDYVQIYLKQVDDGFFLTDEGATMGGLLDEGYTFDTPEQQKTLERMLNGYGVMEESGKLQIKATVDNLLLKIRSLVQAIRSANDMVASVPSDDLLNM
jgi:hypothetical protein